MAFRPKLINFEQGLKVQGYRFYGDGLACCRINPASLKEARFNMSPENKRGDQSRLTLSGCALKRFRM